MMGGALGLRGTWEQGPGRPFASLRVGAGTEAGLRALSGRLGLGWAPRWLWGSVGFELAGSASLGLEGLGTDARTAVVGVVQPELQASLGLGRWWLGLWGAVALNPPRVALGPQRVDLGPIRGGLVLALDLGGSPP